MHSKGPRSGPSWTEPSRGGNSYGARWGPGVPVPTSVYSTTQNRAPSDGRLPVALSGAHSPPDWMGAVLAASRTRGSSSVGTGSSLKNHSGGVWIDTWSCASSCSTHAEALEAGRGWSGFVPPSGRSRSNGKVIPATATRATSPATAPRRTRSRRALRATPRRSDSAGGTRSNPSRRIVRRFLSSLIAHSFQLFSKGLAGSGQVGPGRPVRAPHRRCHVGDRQVRHVAEHHGLLLSPREAANGPPQV